MAIDTESPPTKGRGGLLQRLRVYKPGSLLGRMSEPGHGFSTEIFSGSLTEEELIDVRCRALIDPEIIQSFANALAAKENRLERFPNVSLGWLVSNNMHEDPRFCAGAVASRIRHALIRIEHGEQGPYEILYRSRRDPNDHSKIIRQAWVEELSEPSVQKKLSSLAEQFEGFYNNNNINHYPLIIEKINSFFGNPQ